MRGFFVTGTDTGVGKTLVAAALLRALTQIGHKVQAFKPVASGCVVTANGLRCADAEILQQQIADKVPYADLNPYAFAPAIAPHIAAAEAGVTIDLAVIRQKAEHLMTRADHLVVEGAGGWYVPLGNGHTMASLAKELGLAVILVIGLRLGCLNHALLSAEAIKATGLPWAGWVANTMVGAMDRGEENVAALSDRLSAPHLATIPDLSAATVDHRISQIAALLPLESLLYNN